MLNWSLSHACMCISWSLRLFSKKFLHACPYYCYSPQIHLVIGRIGSFVHVLKAWSWFNSYMLCFTSCSWNLFELCLIDSPLGLDFTNRALNHVIIWVLKCFPDNWPWRIEFDALKLDFELEVQIWKFQILDSRSSGVSGARVGNSCI